MNRKEKLEQQNDISIIGNLPKRLQRKIAEDLQLNGFANVQKPQFCDVVSTNNHNAKQANTATMPSIKADEPTSSAQQNDSTKTGYLSLNKQHVNAAATNHSSNRRGFLQNAEHAVRSASSDNFNSNFIAVPGILRLRSRADEQKFDNVKKHQINDISTQLLTSPVHQHKQKSARPAWLNALDTPLLKQLSELHGVYVQLQEQQTLYENWSDFVDLRSQMEHIFLQLLLHHIKFCCEHKVDVYFWKLLYYNVREDLKQCSMKSKANERILLVLEDGLTSYAHLYNQISIKYAKQSAEMPHRFESVAKVMGQKFLICLGDLCRYKTKQLQSNDYSNAITYYKEAQALIPSNGIPYNQLAVVSIIQHKLFDAVYFHMRSLMSSNSICSARESLLGLFYELRRKFKDLESKSSPLHLNSLERWATKSLRKEVWIYPDGARRLHRTDINNFKSLINEENRLNELSTEDIWRYFTLLYLHIIGKLYAAIGMETLHEHQRKFLVHFNVLLKRDLWFSSSSKLLKIAALNIFIIEQNKKDSRREVRYHAFNFCNQILGLLTRRANELLSKSVDNDNLQELPQQSFEELNRLLQFISVYLMWLQMNIDIWEPVRSEEHIILDSWQELRQLFSHINKLLLTTAFYNLAIDQNAILEEHNFFAGFTPLQTSQHTQSQAAADCNKPGQLMQLAMRMHKIAQFQKCYKKHHEHLAMLDNDAFVLEDQQADIKTAINHLQINCDENNENEGVGAIKRCKSTTEIKMPLNNCNNTDDAQLTELSRLKKQLEAQTHVKKMYNEKFEQILKYVDSKVFMEVRPKYLLPDTNCFIDCLEDFERLVQNFKHYTLIVPLTVVKELDGLSKGVKASFSQLPQSRIQHFDEVTSMAKKSLEFIRTTKNIKCATTKGSFINSSLFGLVEEEHMSNDDKILATAVALSKTQSNETSKDGKCFIQTELVLITTDRNLRVKALTRNLAVSGLKEFMQWAKDCNNL